MTQQPQDLREQISKEAKKHLDALLFPRVQITGNVLDNLLALTEHDRIPTELELDRFIRSLGYVKQDKGL